MFSTVSRALWTAATLSSGPLSLQPPLPVPHKTGEMWQIAAIAPDRRAGTLAEAMAHLSAADLDGFLDGDSAERREPAG